MFLTVIVPTCNRNDLLRKCLNNLVPEIQTLDSSKYEVIVSDDTKFNKEIESLKKEYPFIHFISGPKKGPASNRNFGAKHSNGDWLVFIDDDCVPDCNILLNYHKEIIREKYTAIEGYINADREQERFDEQSPLNLNGGCFWSCNIAVSKKIYDIVGGFDEGFPFPALEDTDFYERLKLVAKTTFLENARVMHPWRRMIPFANYKKKIISHQFVLNKTNTEKNFSYRIKRLKLFIGISISNTKKLIKYSFKGVGFYLEVNWFNFLMIFK
jgi:glycosyltransferase involved in cell wall biosynthesis